MYRAAVTTEDNKLDKTYIGLTENTSKQDLQNHKVSFNNKTKRLNTELNKYIWQPALYLAIFEQGWGSADIFSLITRGAAMSLLRAL